MLGLSPWVSFLAVVLIAAAARLLPPLRVPTLQRALDASWAPAVAGALTGMVTLWAWGSLHRTPVLHDESAYLLQAQLFAGGRWVGARPPLPEFFEQLYVLVEPVLASKYPPGNSLLVAPGALIGLPGLPVVVMSGLSAAFLFGLARRVCGSPVALLTALLWITSFPAIYYHASYLSEGTTSLMWLATWWGIVRWRAGEGARWLIVGAVALAWCLITRPLTGLALGIVALFPVLRHASLSRTWRDLAPASAAFVVVCCLVPIWSWRTTGNPLEAPLSLYTRTYVPFDKPGFGVDRAERPSSRLPADQQLTSLAFYQEHERHTLSSLPRIAWGRLRTIVRDSWYEWRGGLQIFAIIGLFVLPMEVLLALAAFGLQFLLYLSYAHPAGWTVYYIEGAPILALITAFGIVRVLAWASRGAPERFRSSMAMTVALIAPIALVVAGQVRAQIESDHAYHESFQAVLSQMPAGKSIVFVRYGPHHLDGLSLVRNVPDLASAPTWTVYDRGRDNERLLRLAPERAAYLFDEATWTLTATQRPVATTRTLSGAGQAPAAGSIARR